MDPHESHYPAELQEVERLLRAERVAPTALELDGMKRHINARSSRAAAAPRSRRFSFMKSRMAITMMVVVGMLLSTSGVGLALDGTSGDGSAAGVQYQPPQTTPLVPPPTTPTTPLVPPPTTTTTESLTPPTTPTKPGQQNQQPEQIKVQSESKKPSKQTTQPTTPQPTPTEQQVQPVQQVAATEVSPQGTLPFTGYNAIPIAIIGFALMAVGGVLWRMSRRQPDA